MKTYIIHLNIAASSDNKPFKTQVRETARNMEEAHSKALDGWPVGSEITSAWEV